MAAAASLGECCAGLSRAYVDESFRNASKGGLYLVAAVSVETEDEEGSRFSLRKALPRLMSRFHWRVDSDRVRNIAISTVAQLPITTTIFIRESVPKKQQERHRQHLFWNLVPHLSNLCQHDLMFEARERGQDAKDTKTLSNIAKSGAGGAKFQYTFGRPLDEPLLWLPDIVVGATGLKLAEGNDRWWEILPEKPTLVYVPPP